MGLTTAEAGVTIAEGLGAGGVGLIIAGIEGTGNQGVDIGLESAGTLGVATALAFAPETFGLSLLFGGAMYGLSKGAEAVLNLGQDSEREYAEKRTRELGTHELDQREINYRRYELKTAKKYYEDQVKYQNTGTSERSVKQREQDQEMLNNINKNLESLDNAYYNNEPVYSLASDSFNPDNLSKNDKKEYDRLQKRVKNAQDRVFYHGGDPAKLELQELRLQRFIDKNLNDTSSHNYINPASTEQIDEATKNYIEYGEEVYGTVSYTHLTLPTILLV